MCFIVLKFEKLCRCQICVRSSVLNKKNFKKFSNLFVKLNKILFFDFFEMKNYIVCFQSQITIDTMKLLIDIDFERFLIIAI